MPIAYGEREVLQITTRRISRHEMNRMEANQYRLPQFSLRSALISMVVFGVAASFWVSLRANRESLRLREENVRLRNEVGELTIEPGNENKVHAIAVPELEARTWKWR